MFPVGVLNGARSTRTLARSFSFRPKKSALVNEMRFSKILPDKQKEVAQVLRLVVGFILFCLFHCLSFSAW